MIGLIAARAAGPGPCLRTEVIAGRLISVNSARITPSGQVWAKLRRLAAKIKLFLFITPLERYSYG